MEFAARSMTDSASGRINAMMTGMDAIQAEVDALNIIIIIYNYHIHIHIISEFFRQLMVDTLLL